MPRSPRVSPRAMVPQVEWRTSPAGCPGTYDPRFAVMAGPSHADLMQYYGMAHAHIDTVVPQVRGRREADEGGKDERLYSFAHLLSY